MYPIQVISVPVDIVYCTICTPSRSLVFLQTLSVYSTICTPIQVISVPVDIVYSTICTPIQVTSVPTDTVCLQYHLYPIQVISVPVDTVYSTICTPSRSLVFLQTLFTVLYVPHPGHLCSCRHCLQYHLHPIQVTNVPADTVYNTICTPSRSLVFLQTLFTVPFVRHPGH